MKRLGLVLMLLLACAGCARDRREAGLREAMTQAVAMVNAPGVREAVRRQDPSVRPSSVVAYLTAQGAIAQHPAPDGIAFTIGQRARMPWCVVIRASDEQHAVIIEGYGPRIDRPELTQNIEIPPLTHASSPTPTPDRKT